MSTPSLTTTSVATESVCPPSDTIIGWVVYHKVLDEFNVFGRVFLQNLQAFCTLKLAKGAEKSSFSFFYSCPTSKGGMQNGICTRYITCFCTIGADLYYMYVHTYASSRCLLTKISASELGRKFVKSAFVGCWVLRLFFI